MLHSFIIVPNIWIANFRVNTHKASLSLQTSPLVSALSPNLVPIPLLGGSRGLTPRCSSPHGISKGPSWSAVCLRPTAPLRPCLALGAAPGGPYQRYNTRRPTTYKEDGQILDVIEAYCSLGKPRSTVNSGKYWFIIVRSYKYVPWINTPHRMQSTSR